MLRIALLFYSCLLALTVHAVETAKPMGPPPADGPLEVRIGFNLVNITAIVEKEETLDFEGAIYLYWLDRRLAYEAEDFDFQDWQPGDYSQTPPQIYQGDYAVKELFDGWRLHLVIPNGIGDRAKTNMAIGIWPDGMVGYFETFYAKAETPMQLRRFPYDVQQLEIFFHPFVYRRSEVALVPDDTLSRTWQQNLGIAEWAQGPVSIVERPVEIAYFDDAKEVVSELVVTVNLSRQPLHILTSIIFPMVLLVALTWSVFWMDTESMSSRINITFIGILSVVAYYLVIQESVPKIDYLTLIDGFILATFMVLTAGVVVTVYMGRLEERNLTALSRRVDRICRWAFPLGYALISGFMHILFFSLD